MILIGELSLWVALLMAAWSTTVSFAGGSSRRDDLIDSGVRGLYATFAMVLLASIGLWTALLSRDFSLDYVAGHISANMPSVYVFTAFWSAQEGSLLFWALILSLYGTIAISTSRAKNRELTPWATGTLSAILLFFIVTTCLKANPFTRLASAPIDGRGMNPQLMSPGMAIHPPMLYLGYVATAIPFAFAIAALFARKLDAEWLAVVRRWSLLSWFFLTAGILLGMRWAYAELGWGGYWAWDAVENLALLPWLTTTAFLHSIMLQERRGTLRKWNVVLVVVSFLLAILGTFIARGGGIESVHSFVQSPAGPWFATFFFLATGMSIYLMGARLHDVGANAPLEGTVSGEAALLSSTVVLCAIALAVLAGTLFPILSEWAGRPKTTVGPRFFNGVNAPLGLVLLALMGIGQGVRAWRWRHREQAATAVLRPVGGTRRRYGGYVVHAGIVMLLAAFVGMGFRREHDITLRPGQSYDVADPYGRRWLFVSQGASTSSMPNYEAIGVALDASMDGKRVGLISSEQRQYLDSQRSDLFQPVTEVGIRSTPRLDTYVVFVGAREGDVAELRVTFNPLVMWVWIGGAVVLFGGLVVMWPQAERLRSQPGGDD